jgi:hypothetical protein
VRKADNLPPSCDNVKKSGGLNLLEPCGPVQALPLRQLLLYVPADRGLLPFSEKILKKHPV